MCIRDRFIVDHLGLTSSQFGYLFIPTVSGMIFGSYLSKKSAGNLSHKKTIKIAKKMIFS